MKEDDLDLLSKLVKMTYGSQEEINNRSKDKYKISSVLIYKPIDHINEQIIEYYRLELKGIGINPTWDENMWGFRANIKGELINKLKEKGFIVLLDRKIRLNIF